MEEWEKKDFLNILMASALFQFSSNFSPYFNCFFSSNRHAKISILLSFINYSETFSVYKS